MSTTIELLSKVAADVGAVRKDERNTQQNFNFRGIDAVVNAVAPALRKHGVIVVPQLNSIERSTVEVGQKRTLMGHVSVDVTYIFYGGGSTVEARVPGEAMDSGDKATAKAMSVAFRTALLQVLTLPTDELDPDAESFERSDTAPDPDELARLGTNRLKAEALELVAGDKEEATALWAQTLANFDLKADEVVPLDQQETVRTELKANAEVAK